MAARKEITLEGWNKKRASAGQPGRAPIYIYRPSGEEKLGGKNHRSALSDACLLEKPEPRTRDSG